MNNHKLIQTLKTFNRKEWREFSKFVESPYFNTDKHCIRLLEILKREFAKKDGFQLSRTRLEKLFSKNNVADASLLNVKLSLLTRLAEQFFTHQELEEKPLLSKHFLLKRLLKRGLNSHFESTYRRNIKLHESPEKIDPEHYLDRYFIQEDFLAYTIVSDKKTLLARENIQDTNESLDIFYMIKKINLFVRMRAIGKIFQKSYDLDSFKFIDSMVLLPPYANHPLVQLYYAIYMLQQNYNSQNFNHLMKLLKKHGDALPPDNLQSFYIVAANYCAAQLRKGKDYYKEIHDIYVDMEVSGSLITREWAHVRTLQNVIISGLNLNKFEWADHMIEKYKDKIKPSIRSGAYHYFRALYTFYNKEFGKAISYFLKASSVDHEFNMSIKMFLLKSYYEQDTEYSHHTEQTIRSYKVFFKQSKYFSKQTKDAFINFGNIIYYLYRIKHREGRVTIEDVLEKIEQCELLMSEKWLLEKIKELQNRPTRRAQC